MNKEFTKLLDEIGKKRAELLKLGNQTGLNSLETLHCSVELDKLITTYQELDLRHKSNIVKKT